MADVSINEAMNRLPEFVGRARDLHEEITITVHGEPAAVLVDPRMYESMKQTLGALSDPQMLGDLEESVSGRRHGGDDVRRDIENRGALEASDRGLRLLRERLRALNHRSDAGRPSAPSKNVPTQFAPMPPAPPEIALAEQAADLVNQFTDGVKMALEESAAERTLPTRTRTRPRAGDVTEEP
jgi:antitoxin YefM